MAKNLSLIKTRYLSQRFSSATSGRRKSKGTCKPRFTQKTTAIKIKVVAVKIFRHSNGIMANKMVIILTLIATSLRPRQMSTLRFGSALPVL